MQGFTATLEKKSRGRSLMSVGGRSWAGRNFKLVRQNLEYYHGTVLKGTINMDESICQDIPPDHPEADGKEFAFCLTTSNDEKMYLNAATWGLRYKCIGVFNRASQTAEWDHPEDNELFRQEVEAAIEEHERVVAANRRGGYQRRERKNDGWRDSSPSIHNTPDQVREDSIFEKKRTSDMNSAARESFITVLNERNSLMAGGTRGSSSLPQQDSSSSSTGSRASASDRMSSMNMSMNSATNRPAPAPTAAPATATAAAAAAPVDAASAAPEDLLRASEAAITQEAAAAPVEAMPTLDAAPDRAALMAQMQNPDSRYSRQQLSNLPAPAPLARFMTDDLAKEYVFSDDPSKQIHGTQYFRKLVSTPDRSIVHGAIDRVIKLGVVPRMVLFLKSDVDPPLQFQAAWVMTNIASGDHSQTRVVVESGAAAEFEKMLVAADEQVREQAAWALGNIAGDSIEFRDKLLSMATITVLARSMEIYGSENNMPMMRNAAWLVSNLFRGQPRPELELVQPALPLLVKFICDHEDPDLLADSCWALSYICDGPNERIDVVVRTPYVLARVAAILCDTSLPIFVRQPALRIVGNICTGEEAQTRTVIDEGLIEVLHNLSQYSMLDADAAIDRINAAALAALKAGNSNSAGAAAANSAAAEAEAMRIEAERAEAQREGVVAESARRSLHNDGAAEDAAAAAAQASGSSATGAAAASSGSSGGGGGGGGCCTVRFFSCCCCNPCRSRLTLRIAARGLHYRRH
mmetsp:Transcript_12555/g.20885  ORF Transcript_12555/g.20885 Transcript_12555/m.20885 type:complete len:749 (+) Transcript_12555:75-2321(+)